MPLSCNPARRALRRQWFIGAPCLIVLSAVLGPTPEGIVALALLGPALLALLLYDVRYLILPDPLVAFVLVTGLGYSAISAGGALNDALIGVVVGGGALWALREAFVRLRGVAGLGLGDVKLFAASAAWVGWRELPVVLLIACLATLGVVGVERLWTRLRTGEKSWRRARLPFGPGLVVALYVWVVIRIMA